MKGTWQTTDSGGSGAGIAVAAIAIAIVAVPVIDAIARIAEVFVIALGAVVGLAVLAGAAVVVYRLRCAVAPALGGQPNHGRVVQLPRAAKPAEPLQEPRRQAIGVPQEVHLHLHGINAAELAAALDRVNLDQD